jgi:hypothetical protein
MADPAISIKEKIKRISFRFCKLADIFFMKRVVAFSINTLNFFAPKSQ